MKNELNTKNIYNDNDYFPLISSTEEDCYLIDKTLNDLLISLRIPFSCFDENDTYLSHLLDIYNKKIISDIHNSRRSFKKKCLLYKKYKNDFFKQLKTYYKNNVRTFEPPEEYYKNQLNFINNDIYIDDEE